jgi:hypothetical protein
MFTLSLSIILLFISQINPFELFRVDLGYKYSSNLQTAEDPRSFARYSFSRNDIFIYNPDNYTIIKKSITHSKDSGKVFLANINLMGMWVYNDNLLVHSHGSNYFELYDIATGKKKQQMLFPYDIKYHSPEMFYNGWFYFTSRPSVYKLKCQLIQDNAAYYITPYSSYESEYLANPIIDYDDTLAFSLVSIDNYVDQNENYILLRKQPEHYPTKYKTIYYLYDKKSKIFSKILFSPSLDKEYDGGTIKNGFIYLFTYDVKTIEFVLYKIPVAKLNLALFDPISFEFPDEE